MVKSLEELRHSTSHILAAAVVKLYPGVKLAIGPAIEEGFYYDFDDLKITENDLVKIENEMRRIVKKNYPFSKEKINKAEAKKRLKNQPYKLELLDEIKGDISFYKTGDVFEDLCSGPHVKNTSEIKQFKLLRIAGAYWKGDSKNKMLTRIYGTAFYSEKELRDYLKQLEEIEKRNHIRIGKDMGIFIISSLVGKGLPIWLPKGNIIKEEIEKLAKEKEDEAGYLRVSTPHLAKKELYEQSGHLPYYEDSMYPSMKMDDGIYYLKAMNCPHHHLVYKHELRSYRNLPLRIAEYGVCYRNELSGTLAGLLRVRMLTMNDAHIYCSKDQIEDEFVNVIKLVQGYYKIFGLKDYWFRLSKWNPENKKKYIDEPENWRYSEDVIRKVLKKLKVKFVEAEDEAAFYGPKVDIQFKAITGREESMSTIQLDFAAKSRFDLRYQDKNGSMNNEVFVIHRAPLSTHERFMAFLIEHYAGNFPLWLAPVQVKIVTVNDSNSKYAKEIVKLLEDNKVRVELDDRSESIGKKVRDAEVEKTALIVTIGDKEVKGKTLAVRDSKGKVKFGVKPKTFVKEVVDDIETRKC
ncbi:threonine--tRNA ligase [Candidatus Woesearchaeota archaeon]|nr:threonine--tRNA ligase [Candidatus Woesearchaeota archaeon]